MPNGNHQSRHSCLIDQTPCFHQTQAFEPVETLLEIIKSTLESDEDGYYNEIRLDTAWDLKPALPKSQPFTTAIDLQIYFACVTSSKSYSSQNPQSVGIP